MSGLTADDVLNAKFNTTKFREGYDQDEVDDFLDQVVALLESADDGAPDARATVAALCREARFTPTKLREGYDYRDVDDLLGRLSGGAPAAAVATGPTPPTVEAGRPSTGATVLVVAAVIAALAVALAMVLG